MASSSGGASGCEPVTTSTKKHHLPFKGKSKVVQHSLHAMQMVWQIRVGVLWRVVGCCLYCYTSQTADIRIGTKYRDSAFILRGFTNWKDGMVGLTKHESSDCHKEAVDVMDVLPRTQHIGDQLPQIHTASKKLNRIILLKILQYSMTQHCFTRWCPRVWK